MTLTCTPSCESSRTSAAVDSRRRVRDRDLDVDVRRPSSRSRAPARASRRQSSAKTSNEIGPVGDAARARLSAKAGVVGDAGLAHQRRVGGEALDAGVSGQRAAGSSRSAPSAKILTVRRSCLVAQCRLPAIRAVACATRRAAASTSSTPVIRRLPRPSAMRRRRVLDEDRTTPRGAPRADVDVGVADHPRWRERSETPSAAAASRIRPGAACGSRTPAELGVGPRPDGGGSSARRRWPRRPPPAVARSRAWTASSSASVCRALRRSRLVRHHRQRQARPARAAAAPRRQPGVRTTSSARYGDSGRPLSGSTTTSLMTPSRSRKTARRHCVTCRRLAFSHDALPCRLACARAPGARRAGARQRPGSPRCAG